ITVGGLTNATAAGLTGKDLKYAAVDMAGAGFDAGEIVKEIADGEIEVNGIGLGKIAAASSNEERMGQMIAAINAKTADTGVTAFASLDAAGKITGYELRGGEDGVKIALKTSSTADLAKIAGIDAANVDGTTGKGLAVAATGGVSALDITTQSGAWAAIQHMDAAIDQVNAARGDLGALQTRFEKTVENIDIQNENISAARGRIVDADFASETANLSRSQILQQAGTAMVAQANQLPQNVLSLLR
ncbi:MAG: flagellin, partial [Comamonas sp.]